VQFDVIRPLFPDIDAKVNLCYNKWMITPESIDNLNETANYRQTGSSKEKS
jgi:hypothetical protein